MPQEVEVNSTIHNATRNAATNFSIMRSSGCDGKRQRFVQLIPQRRNKIARQVAVKRPSCKSAFRRSPLAQYNKSSTSPTPTPSPTALPLCLFPKHEITNLTACCAEIYHRCYNRRKLWKMVGTCGYRLVFA